MGWRRQFFFVGKNPGARTQLVTQRPCFRDGRWFAFIDTEGRAHVGRTDGSAKDPLMLAKPANVDNLALSPDGRQIACAVSIKEERRIHLCDTATGKVMREVLADPDSDVRSLCYSPDGTLLAGTAHVGTVLVWETGLPALKDEVVEAKSTPAAPPKIQPAAAISIEEVFDDPLPEGVLRRSHHAFSAPETTYSFRPAPAERSLPPTAKGAIQIWELPAWTAGPVLLPDATEEMVRFESFSFTADGTLAAYDSRHRLTLFDPDGSGNRRLSCPKRSA